MPLGCFLARMLNCWEKCLQHCMCISVHLGPRQVWQNPTSLGLADRLQQAAASGQCKEWTSITKLVSDPVRKEKKSREGLKALICSGRAYFCKKMIVHFRWEVYFPLYTLIVLYCLLTEQQRNGLNLIVLQLTTAEKKAGAESIRYHTGAPLYKLFLLMAFCFMTTLSQWHLKLWSPHHFVQHHQCSVHCFHTNQLFWALSDTLWLAGRLRVADEVNPVNMARDKAIPKVTVTTKLAHRVQGMEVLFIFCALGSAAIPHVS